MTVFITKGEDVAEGVYVKDILYWKNTLQSILLKVELSMVAKVDNKG